MLISVIVTTYNRPDALKLVLQALAQQNDANFEVLIADDGSTSETADVIKDNHWSFPMKHIWHEDQGFRAARIRNLAVEKSQGDYLLFIDGDCVPRSDFIQRHRQRAERGWFVSGRRILLNSALTTAAITGAQKIVGWSYWEWIKARFQGQCNRVLPLLRISLFDGKNRPTQWRGAKTCNLAIWREDFLRVKGFDEHYTGWGYEDSDLVIRLLRAKVFRKQGGNAVTVLHLWHLENDRQHQAENWQRLLHTQRSDSIAPEGES